jgi:putative phage-type endonuclease
MKAATDRAVRADCSHARREGEAVSEGFLLGVTARISRARRPAGYLVEIDDRAGVQRKRFGTVEQVLEARRVALDAGARRLTLGDEDSRDTLERLEAVRSGWNRATAKRLELEAASTAEAAFERAVVDLTRPGQAERERAYLEQLEVGGPRISPNVPEQVELVLERPALPDPEQDRAAWLEWRRGGLGGSDVASILGLSPWSGPFDVWLAKTQAVDGQANRAQNSGRRLERAIAEFAADELGAVLLPSEALEHPEHPWIRGTPDGYLEPGRLPLLVRGGRAGLECKKTRDLEAWGEPGSSSIPVAYRVQVAWYQAITRIPTWFVAVFATISDRWEIYRVERDLEVENALIERAGQWWRRHVVEGVRPELDSSSSCSLALHLAHAKPSDELLEVDDARDLVERWSAAKQAEAEAIDTRKALEAEVKAAIGDAKGIRGEWGRVNWSRFERSSLDAKRLRAEHPELENLLERYTRKTPSSRLSAKLEGT